VEERLYDSHVSGGLMGGIIKMKPAEKDTAYLYVCKDAGDVVCRDAYESDDIALCHNHCLPKAK